MSIDSTVAKTIEILSIEDNTADQWLISDMLGKGTKKFHVSFVSDGEAGMDYLLKRGIHAQASRPDFILLDLNLPKKDGFEVLAEVRAIPELRDIPILMFTTSKAQQDLSKCMALGADLYIVKPTTLDGFAVVLECIETFCTAFLSSAGAKPEP